MTRYREPFYQPGATRFTDDRAIGGPRRLMALVASSPIGPALQAATTVPHTWGRHREPGQWALVYLAFVISGQVDVEPWWTTTDDVLWQDAGFTARPSYTTTYERFRELEAFADAFDEAAGDLIALARRSDPRVGAHVLVDSTEAETHAGLVHDCRDGDACPNETGGGRRAPHRAERAPTDDHRRVRHDEDELDEDAAGRPDGIERREIWAAATGRQYLRLRIGEHCYRSLDVDAGARAYSGAGGAYKFWHGYYNQKATDLLTGGPLSIVVDSASRQEYDIYPELYRRLEANLQATPESVIVDKGFAVRRVFEHNTRRGIATIAPKRGRARDTELADRHDIPRCPHCGADTTFARFAHTPSPRLWFTCNAGLTAKCGPATPGGKYPQLSRACSSDWSQLLPLWRTDPLFAELSAARGLYERAHRHWRERYCVAGDTLSTRPKRRGLAVQRLRSAAAMLIEWLRICDRHGWLPGSTRRVFDALKRVTKGVTRRIEELRAERRSAKLHLPYGAAATAVGIPDVGIPPSERRPAKR
jgi:hypothetical protein